MPIHMSRSVNRIGKVSLTLVFGLAAFVFWRMRFPHALAFQEQLQLFLLDGDFLWSRVAEPGGVARYVAEFLVQLYNNVTLGAVVIALLYMLMQRLVWRLMQPVSDAWYPLSFLPVALVWLLMGDESVLLTMVVSLILALLAMWCVPQNKWARWGYILIFLPILYWLVGPLAWMVALYLPFSRKKEHDSVGQMMVQLVAGVVWLALFVWLLTRCLPYPAQRLYFGLSYYRYVQTLPYLLVVIALLCVALAAFGHLLGRVAVKRSKVVAIGSLAAVVLLLAIGLPASFEQRKYDLIEYDYLVRAGQWDAIIDKSTAKQPDLPMSVCATNLALAMKGQLGDRAFAFYQRGVGGLLPKFERNFATLQLTGEAYFQLGLVNTAQRFAFEAMEAIPNYNKSGRAIKRLAETNLINGKYQVAAKYLSMLKKTIFYRNWALRTEQLLGQEERINSHPLYGKMRRMRLTNDLLFSEDEIDKICGQLFLRDNQNTMAIQYLLLCPLLKGDVDTFMNYLQVVRSKVPYQSTVSQQALAYALMSHNQEIPAGVVSPMVLQQLQEFVQTYKSAGINSPQMQRFKETVWYYLSGGGQP